MLTGMDLTKNEIQADVIGMLCKVNSKHGAKFPCHCLCEKLAYYT